MASSTIEQLPKIAVCHEWFDNIGGGEKVLFELLEITRASKLFVLWADKELVKELPCEVETSFLQRFPQKVRRQLGLCFMPLAWLMLRKKLRNYDLVVSSSWAFAHFASRYQKLDISYVHTPGRYWWFPEIDRRTKWAIPKTVFRLLRWIDKLGTSQFIVYLANSATTQKRIRQCWGRESKVVNPPVDTEFYSRDAATNIAPFDKYLLGVGRFVEYKNHKFIIQLGEKLGIPVILVGQGELYSELKRYGSESSIPVHVIQQATNIELRNLYSFADCLVYPVIEDFGIVAVEAMSCGTRVLGLDQAGLKETVVQNVTGFLCEELTLDSFYNGYSKLPEHNPNQIASYAQKYGRKKFHQEIQFIIDTTLSKNRIQS